MIAFLMKPTDFYFLFIEYGTTRPIGDHLYQLRTCPPSIKKIWEKRHLSKEISLLYVKGEAGAIRFVTWDSRSHQATQ